MREPSVTLDREGRAFWDRHYERLTAEGILTENDLETFACCCMTWSMIVELREIRPGAGSFREMIQFNNLNKQFLAYAKQFGLLPRERRAAKMEASPTSTKDEFGL